MFVANILKDMKADQGEMMSIGESGGYKTGDNERIKVREKLALSEKIDEEAPRGMRGKMEGIGTENFLHGPMD